MINTSILGQAYAAMYSGRLKYIVPSKAELLEDRILITLTADKYQWKKINEEVATWVPTSDKLTVEESRLILQTKEEQAITIVRSGGAN